MSERNTTDPFHVTRVVEHARVLISLEKDGRSPSRHKQARRPVVARGAARRGVLPDATSAALRAALCLDRARAFRAPPGVRAPARPSSRLLPRRRRARRPASRRGARCGAAATPMRPVQRKNGDPLFAARTLSVTGQYRVTLIAAIRAIKSSLWVTTGGKGAEIRPKRSSQAT